MNYLYGDSTKSHLKQNFLEFLRDSLDFCVLVLQSDARIKRGRVRIEELGEAAAVETARLDRFITGVNQAVNAGEKGATDSPTAHCATRLTALVLDAHRSSLDNIKRDLAAEIARIEEEEAATREACVRALANLLAPHEPPGSTTTTRVEVGDSGRYIATLEAEADPGLEWTLELGIPDGHAWASPMRVDRLVQHLEIRAPQLAGWITKEVKVKPQRIEKLTIQQVVDDGEEIAFALRSEQGDSGFDFTADIEKKTVTAARIGPADDASVGAFELAAEDLPTVLDLATKIRSSLGGVERLPNIAATFEEADFRSLPEYVTFVRKLVATMTPIVREIAKRSLTPNELVLRRALGDDRREEIFVAKSTLREKLAPLTGEMRALFSSLGLEVGGEAKREPLTSSDRPPMRSELPPSPSSPPKVGVTAPVSTFTPVRSAPPAAPPGGLPAVSPPRARVPTIAAPGAPAPPPPGGSGKNASDSAPEIEVTESDVPSDTILEAMPESSRRGESHPRNEALVGALKKILMLSKNGRGAEAYNEYGRLFASEAFGTYRLEEQRQALKLMVLAKQHPADTAAVQAAHKAALSRLMKLVDATKEPADQELLGVTHAVLGDEKAAAAAFQAGLDAERAKNPSSDLIASLMRRVSQL